MFEPQTLRIIANQFHAAQIRWAIGGSVLLHYYGLATSPNDLDLVLHLEDWPQAKRILDRLGTGVEAQRKASYVTKQFDQYRVGQTDIDVMAGFAIQHPTGVYEYVLDGEAIVARTELDGVSILLGALEDWYVLYLLMEREEKASLIESELSRNGVKHPFLLERALDQPLPKQVKAKVETLIRKLLYQTGDSV